MTKDEALKLAMEGLETPWNAPYVDGCDLALGKKVKAITAIKEALAQPEQESIGEIVDAIEGAFKCSFTKMLPVGTKLYTTPPQRTWVGLTRMELIKCGVLPYGMSYELYEAIEAKLRSKNS